MLIEAFIDRIEALYAKGVPSDESSLSPRHIYLKMKSVRMQLLTQQIKKRQKLSDWNYTILPCVELIKVPSHECACLGEIGCDVYRTKYPLPKIITDSNKHYIDFVMTVDSGKRLEEISREGVLYLKGNKYTANKPKYVIENGHLYFPVKKSPGIVKIKFLAEDPIEAKTYPSFCDDCQDCIDCTPMTKYEFPIDGNLIETLITLCKEELLGEFNRALKDTNNDSTDNQKRQEE
jgi:hypothetical protein